MKSVKTLQQKIEDIHKQIKLIQDNCQHFEKYTKRIVEERRWVRYTCTLCQKHWYENQ